MQSVYQKLYDTYGEAVLKELDGFPSAAVTDFLKALPIEESRRIDLFDRSFRFYMQWSADAFCAGLHLGLSLLGGNVRCPGAEKT